MGLVGENDLRCDFLGRIDGLVHKQIFLPFRTGFGVVAQEDVIETETQQLLGSKQRHTGLFGSAVTLALVAADAGSHKVLRGALAALRTGQDMVERQVLGLAMLTAILAQVAVANVDTRPFHRCLAAIPAHVYIVTQPDHGRDLEYGRGGTQHVVAVSLLNEDGPAEPQAHRSGDTNSAKRFIRKI